MKYLCVLLSMTMISPIWAADCTPLSFTTSGFQQFAQSIDSDRASRGESCLAPAASFYSPQDDGQDSLSMTPHSGPSQPSPQSRSPSNAGFWYGGDSPREDLPVSAISICLQLQRTPTISLIDGYPKVSEITANLLRGFIRLGGQRKPILAMQSNTPFLTYTQCILEQPPKKIRSFANALIFRQKEVIEDFLNDCAYVNPTLILTREDAQRILESLYDDLEAYLTFMNG